MCKTYAAARQTVLQIIVVKVPRYKDHLPSIATIRIAKQHLPLNQMRKKEMMKAAPTYTSSSKTACTLTAHSSLVLIGNMIQEEAMEVKLAIMGGKESVI